jgi:EAL domain-containing protein (putative c-di-GMP-specific phosphodiesterase class I)
LRRAITRDELVLHYQPKIDVATRRLVGVEALVRWQHPEQGLLGPGQFIPIAERSGLIGPLTATVLARAPEQARAWLEAGTELAMAVNVAPRVLADADFPDAVARALATAGVPARLLELEITESGLMQEPARTLEHLERLHALGVRLSIDDFGTGYSSLSRLRRLPIDHIKIDRSFVGDLQAGGPDAKIVRSAIGLGQSLGLRVIAEGVETEDVLETLAFFGCDEAQGFHIARPLPAEALEAWVAEHAAAPATSAA